SRRGNHASGTPSTRPSDSSTHTLSSSNLRDLAEMLMPCPFDERRVVLDDPRQLGQGPRVEPIAGVEADGRNPKLCRRVAFAHMHMNALTRIAFVRVEKEPIAPLSKNDRHRA